MEPVRHSINSINFTSQPLNLSGTSFGATSQASDTVKKLMDKVSFGILSTQGVKDDKSKVVSATSLAPVLGMLLACMDDKERKALVLGIPADSLTDELEIEIHKKLGEFSVKHAYGEHPDEEQAISCANLLAFANTLNNEQLNQILSECYQTEKLDCQGRWLADVTDAYVNEKTRGKIKSLFGGLSQGERERITAVIANVMEFRGIWEHEMPKHRTVPGRFLCANGSIIKNVIMMCSTEVLQFVHNKDFGAIGKKFRSANGEDLKLVAITPADSENPTAIDKLDYETIDHLIDRLNYREVKLDLKLPKIKMTDSCDTHLLDKISQTFGTDIIKAEDLSRLGKPGGQQLEILQKVSLSVDEEGAHGTVATAATRRLRGMSKGCYFHFDCPGYIAIVDRQGNRLLEMMIKDGSFFEFQGEP